MSTTQKNPKFINGSKYTMDEINKWEKIIKGHPFVNQYKMFLSEFGAADYYGLKFFELHNLNHFSFLNWKDRLIVDSLLGSTPIAVDHLNNYLCFMQNYGASYYESKTKLCYVNNDWNQIFPLDYSFNEFLELYKTNELNPNSETNIFFSKLHDGTKSKESNLIFIRPRMKKLNLIKRLLNKLKEKNT